MARVIWTPVAESDLDDILFYIAFVDRRPITGERLYYELRDSVLEHAESKRPGHVHPHAPEGWLYSRAHPRTACGGEREDFRLGQGVIPTADQRTDPLRNRDDAQAENLPFPPGFAKFASSASSSQLRRYTPNMRRCSSLHPTRIWSKRRSQWVLGLALMHKRWLIFYVPLPDGIEVMRVIDGVRDLPHRLLEP